MQGKHPFSVLSRTFHFLGLSGPEVVGVILVPTYIYFDSRVYVCFPGKISQWAGMVTGAPVGALVFYFISVAFSIDNIRRLSILIVHFDETVVHASDKIGRGSCVYSTEIAIRIEHKGVQRT